MSTFVDTEEMRRAASTMLSAADNMNHAAREMNSAVERLERVWSFTIAPDLAAIMNRLEEVQRKQAS